jgi:hypothetical protein
MTDCTNLAGSLLGTPALLSCVMLSAASRSAKPPKSKIEPPCQSRDASYLGELARVRVTSLGLSDPVTPTAIQKDLPNDQTARLVSARGTWMCADRSYRPPLLNTASRVQPNQSNARRLHGVVAEFPAGADELARAGRPAIGTEGQSPPLFTARRIPLILRH